MRILVAPDKFKSSLSAAEAAKIIADGLRRVLANVEIDEQPLADGGEGTMSAIVEAMHGRVIDSVAHDALGRPIQVRFGWLESSSTAVIEMAEASGYWRIAANERDPWRASTFGTGEMIQSAIRFGTHRIILGLGGSVTNDAGAGMAAALGYRFLDGEGSPVHAIPANFLKIAHVQRPLEFPVGKIDGLSDVTNPLLGASGATKVFGPQKGLVAEDLERMEEAMTHFAGVVEKDLGVKARDKPGAGATGGLGFGILAFCEGSLESGFDAIGALTALESRVIQCDIVITAEGGADRQTLNGKGPGSIAKLARKHGKRAIMIAGRIEDPEALETIFHRVIPLSDYPLPLEESVARAAELLGIAAARVAMLECT